MGLRVFQVLESRQPEGPSLRPLLPILSKVTSLAPGTLHEGTPLPGRPVWMDGAEEPTREGAGCLHSLSLGGLARLPQPRPRPSHRPDQRAQQEAGGLAALRQHPAGARTVFRRLLLHAQGPAGEAGETRRTPLLWAALPAGSH